MFLSGVEKAYFWHGTGPRQVGPRGSDFGGLAISKFAFPVLFYALRSTRQGPCNKAHTSDKIKEQSYLFRELIQFEGLYERFPSDDSIVSSLRYHSLLLASSFLDEFNRDFTVMAYPPFAGRVAKFKGQIKPVTRRIAQWKDIKLLEFKFEVQLT